MPPGVAASASRGRPPSASARMRPPPSSRSPSSSCRRRCPEPCPTSNQRARTERARPVRALPGTQPRSPQGSTVSCAIVVTVIIMVISTMLWSSSWSRSQHPPPALCPLPSAAAPDWPQRVVRLGIGNEVGRVAVPVQNSPSSDHSEDTNSTASNENTPTCAVRQDHRVSMSSN